jgi:hypothetical protein
VFRHKQATRHGTNIQFQTSYTLSKLILYDCEICDAGITAFSRHMSRIGGLKQLDLGGKHDLGVQGMNTFMKCTCPRAMKAKKFRSQDTDSAGLWPLILERAQEMELPCVSDPCIVKAMVTTIVKAVTTCIVMTIVKRLGDLLRSTTQ